MFINISNHPSCRWKSEQLRSAQEFGVIYDIPFPNIPSDWGAKEVADIVGNCENEVKKLLPVPDEGSLVHVMGESVFTFMLVSLLVKNQYRVVASTTERIISYEGDVKVSEFKFVRFRSYVKQEE